MRLPSWLSLGKRHQHDVDIGGRSSDLCPVRSRSAAYVQLASDATEANHPGDSFKPPKERRRVPGGPVRHSCFPDQHGHGWNARRLSSNARAWVARSAVGTAGISGSIELVRQSRRSTLALRALSQKHVGSVGAIDMPAAGSHARHPVGDLAVICSSGATVACAQLVVPVHVSDRRGFGATASEEVHDACPLPAVDVSMRRALRGLSLQRDLSRGQSGSVTKAWAARVAGDRSATESEMHVAAREPTPWLGTRSRCEPRAFLFEPAHQRGPRASKVVGPCSHSASFIERENPQRRLRGWLPAVRSFPRL